MTVINIYLTEEEKQILNKKQQWYKCSMSTIAETCILKIIKWCDEKNKEKILNERLYTRKGQKTSLKPKCYKYFKLKPLVAETCIKLWIKKDLRRVIENNEDCNRAYSEIDEKLNKTYEPFWNYNETIRNTRRMLKENLDYWERATKSESTKKNKGNAI